jgi:hypothetical protein
MLVGNLDETKFDVNLFIKNRIVALQTEKAAKSLHCCERFHSLQEKEVGVPMSEQVC